MKENLVVDSVDIQVNYVSEDDPRVSEEEIHNYITRAADKFPGGTLQSLELEVDGDKVGIYYGLAPVAFDRIRRITGYLVGTLDRFNDGKRAEEHDRVKHHVA